MTQVLFLTTLISGTLISISSNSWFSAWMGLEINLLSFIPLMTNSKNILSTEATLKYFLIQALASIIFLFSTTLMQLFSINSSIMPNNFFMMLITSTLLLKMGAAPFHFWFPGTMEGLNWKNCLILMTWQKIAPLILLSYLLKMNIFTSTVIILSVIIGSLGGLNQTSLRKLLAYSSINHLGWMIAAMACGENLWELYFIVYTFLTLSLIFMFSTHQIFHLNQSFLTLNSTNSFKLLLYLTLLSLGGLPPFLGFLPKWMVIESLVSTNSSFITIVMVIMTLITLFYYIRLTFSAFLLNYTQMKWISFYTIPSYNLIISIISASISSLGLLICSLIYNFL
uniref:NADH-ubiquinone oxidoreductase chain 2 n=1 Tax=Ocellarnaca fuscotessellata TaxID=3003723 RepID=A0A9E9IWX7_9ORTH|nr:NADH dehydrogenase subunit 2 [Ocellarnaca fuscotessellata]WAM61676.1 NADH dehydrogenase subunit 2 [Ocellarnaca fuscotessellata]